MRKTRLLRVTRAAVIAAMYVVLTFLSSVFGLAYGSVQFRLSEVLTILPLFTADAIPGLAVGCLLANIQSSLGAVDMIFGTGATLIAAILTRALRGVKIRSLPLLSMSMPVLINAVVVAVELSFFIPDAAGASGLLFSFLTVGGGEAAVCYILGIPFYFCISKQPALRRVLSGSAAGRS